MSLHQALFEKVASATSLKSFKQGLEEILTQISDAERSGRLDTKTREMASVVGDFTTSLSMALLRLHINSAPIIKGLSGSRATPTESTSSATLLSSNSRSPFAEPAYRWLISHLENPYPSAPWRDRLAKHSGARRKDIDTWFKVARQKIGWSMIREAYFKTRKEMIQSATLYFVKSDPSRSLETKIIKEFELMRVKAKELYSFDATPLATQLDPGLADPTQEPTSHAKGVLDQHILLPSQSTGSDRAGLNTSYPTPPHPPEDSRSPLADTAHITTSPPEIPSVPFVVTGKRRTRDDDDEPNVQGEIKRFRLSASLASSVALPSPPLSPNLSQASLCAVSPRSNPRKRRLSDSDDQGRAKRRLLGPLGPILRSVSDPAMSSAGDSIESDSLVSSGSTLTPLVEADGSALAREPLFSPPTIPSQLPDCNFHLDSVRPTHLCDDDWNLLTGTISSESSWLTASTWCNESLNPINLDAPLGVSQLSQTCSDPFHMVSLSEGGGVSLTV